jgi:hypothetical protein
MHHDRKHALRFAATTGYTTSLQIDAVTADAIHVSYNTMPDNRPNTYGNFVAIWQNQNQIPFDTDAMQKQAITGNSQRGSLVFSGLSVTKNDYIIGYAVGPVKTESQRFGNVCTSAYVPLGGDSDAPADYTYFMPSAVIKFVGSDSVLFQYNLARGTQPQTNKAWAALWRGDAASYTQPPDAAMPISVNAASGTIGFNGVSIGIGLSYTVGVFTTGWDTDSSKRIQKALACSVTFTND